MIDNKRTILLGAALTGLISAQSCKATDNEMKMPLGEDIQCYGVNSCKGKTACSSKSNSCSGKNSCKGKGWLSMSKQECLDKKGFLDRNAL